VSHQSKTAEILTKQCRGVRSGDRIDATSWVF